MNEINDFLGIAVVGGLLSLVIELVKSKFGTSSDMTKLITLVLSLAVGGGYWFLRSTPFFPTVLGVLAAASTVYAFLLKKGSSEV